MFSLKSYPCCIHLHRLTPDR